MYTGQLKMTKSEIDKDHLVWHVNHILLHLFRVDAKLNLPPHLLVAPASDGEDDEEGGDGGEAEKVLMETRKEERRGHKGPLCNKVPTVGRPLRTKAGKMLG